MHELSAGGGLARLNGFGTISWFLFSFQSYLWLLSPFDLQHALSCALLFLLLDLDFSFLSNGHISWSHAAQHQFPRCLSLTPILANQTTAGLT